MNPQTTYTKETYKEIKMNIKGSNVELEIYDNSALASLPAGGLSDTERPTGMVAAFGPSGDDKPYVLDGGSGTRMGQLDAVCGGFNPLYGDEQIAARAVLAGGSNLVLLNLASPGSRKAMSVAYASFKPAFGPKLVDDGNGMLMAEAGGDSYQFANVAMMIMGGESLRAAGTDDITNQGDLPEAINSALGTADLTGVVNFPIFGMEYDAPGRKGDEIFARVERAESDVFNEFESSLFYIQFGKRVNSSDTMFSNKILFSLSETDQLFDATVVFIDKLGNESIERIKFTIYKNGITSTALYLTKIAQEAIITDGEGAPLTLFDAGATGVTPDDHAATFGSYDFITAEQRQRVINGESITAYNLLRFNTDFITSQEAIYAAVNDIEVVDGFENELGEMEFFLSDGHDGIFDAQSPTDEDGNAVSDMDKTALILSKLYAAYSGSLIPKIKDKEIIRFNFMVDSMLPFEIKSAMVDLSKSKELNHTFGLYYAGEVFASSFDDIIAVKDYRMNVVGDVSECMEVYGQSLVCDNPDVSPIIKRVPWTIDVAYKIGLAYNAEKLMRPFAGKYTGAPDENKFSGPAIGLASSIDFYPDRTMGEHDILAGKRINYVEESVEGSFQMSDLTNNTAITRLSSARNKRVLSIIFLWLYAFLSKKRYIPGNGLSELDKGAIDEWGGKWGAVIDGIAIINETTVAEAENGIYNYRYQIKMKGLPNTYKGVIEILKSV